MDGDACTEQEVHGEAAARQIALAGQPRRGTEEVHLRRCLGRGACALDECLVGEEAVVADARPGIGAQTGDQRGAPDGREQRAERAEEVTLDVEDGTAHTECRQTGRVRRRPARMSDFSTV